MLGDRAVSDLGDLVGIYLRTDACHVYVRGGGGGSWRHFDSGYLTRGGKKRRWVVIRKDTHFAFNRKAYVWVASVVLFGEWWVRSSPV